jgi:hypothetical protein
MDVFNEVIDYESKNIKKLYKEGKVNVVNVVNDDANIASAKVVLFTKAKLQAIAKVVDPVDEIDPVVEMVHEKRRGRQH